MNKVWIVLNILIGSVFSKMTPFRYQLSSYYDTKTAYRLVYPQFSSFLENIIPFKDSDNGTVPNQCKPIKMTLLLRHGTRFSSGGDVGKIASVLEKLKASDLKPQFDGIKGWQNTQTMDVSKTLTPSGAVENVEIASRYCKRFPQLFSLDQLEVYSSTTQRSEASAAAFLNGVAGVSQNVQTGKKPDIQSANKILRFFDLCKNYVALVESEAPELFREFNGFRNTPMMKEAASKLSQRIFQNSTQLLTPGEMKTVWTICGLQRAIYGDREAELWCNLIDDYTSKLLEFYWDLKTYYIKSYGHELNYKPSSSLLQHMYNFITHDDDKSGKRVSLYFGHAETLAPLIALLRLFKDSLPLSAEYFPHLFESRRFRSSLIVPFAANLGFVLYKCDGNEQTTHNTWPHQLDKYMIQLRYNEHVMPFPFTDKAAVSLNEFEEFYHEELFNIDFDKLCDPDSLETTPNVYPPETTPELAGV